MEPASLVVAIGAFAILAIALAVRQRARTRTAWQSAAGQLGLKWEPGSWRVRPRLVGRHAGFPVLVDRYVVSTGKHSTTYTRYTVGYPALGLGLKITRESLGGKLAKLFGGQDIRVGSASFDDEYRIRGRDPDAVRAFLNEARLLRIQRLLGTQRGCEVEDDAIRSQRRGVETDPRVLESTVQVLCRLAAALTGPERDDDPLERAVAAQRAGRCEEALAALSERPPDAAAAGPPDPDVAALKGDILLLGGRFDEARDAFEAGLAAQPDDAELAGLADTARRKAKAPPAGEPEAGEGAQELAPEALDPRAVATALFATSALSHEVHALFEARFAGRRVRWSGEIDRIETYRSDMVFGAGPGLKLVLHLLDLAGGGFGRDVRAVFALPGEVQRERWDERGKRVALEGTLLRCDPFLRMLFLAHGRRAGPE